MTTPVWRSRGVRLVALLLALVAAGLWLWTEVLKDRLIPKRWGEVEQGRVYRSGQLHRALVKETLASHGIDVIVNLSGEEATNPDQQAEIEAARELGIRRVSYPLDGSGRGRARKYIKALISILEARNNGQAVLVHCAAGAYRTGVAIAWYRTLVQGIPPAQAYEEMLAYDVDEDDTAELVEYMNAHLQTVAEALRSAGFIAGVPDPLPYLPVPERLPAGTH